MKMFTFKKSAFLIVSLMALMGLLWGMVPSTANAKNPVKLGLLSPFSPPGDPAAGKRMQWPGRLCCRRNLLRRRVPCSLY